MEYTFRIKGIKIYDPRINEYIISDNPALVMADLARRGILKLGSNWEFTPTFWMKIGELANYVDYIDSFKSYKREYETTRIDSYLLNENEDGGNCPNCSEYNYFTSYRSSKTFRCSACNTLIGRLVNVKVTEEEIL